MTSPVTREHAVTVRVFTQRFSSTPRGARLARRLALHQLDRWRLPYGSETSDTTGLLVAELAALDEGGRGLLLVEALASRWEVLDRVPVGKTVRAELDLARR
ncbi:hypothetical protein [Streptomyces sp. NPDC004284]|uniref:hypothetical protein n=1 Tax=Streptomyces sp. NPDC004284 TaxID=3364695 RepID=UPI0036D14F8B